MGSRRLTDKVVISAFIKQDMFERNLGYRLDGSGNPRMGTVGTPGMFGNTWDSYGTPKINGFRGKLATQGPMYIWTDPETGRTYQTYSNVTNTNFMQNYPGFKEDYEKDIKERQRIAKSLERDIPETETKRRIVSLEESEQIENARKNPNKILLKVLEENEMLKNRLERMEKMMNKNTNNISRAPKRLK